MESCKRKAKKKIWKVIHVALKVTSIFLRLKTQKQINWCDGLWASELLCSSLQAIWEWLIGRDGQNLSWWQCRAESRLSLSLLHEALVCLCAAVDSSSFCFCLTFYFDSLTHCWWADKHIVVIFFNLIKYVFLIKVVWSPCFVLHPSLFLLLLVTKWGFVQKCVVNQVNCVLACFSPDIPWLS